MKLQKRLIKLILLFIITITFNTSYAQNYFPVLDSLITKDLNKGIDCLKSREEGCLNFFNSAIETAEKGKDSTLAMTYKEVVKWLYNYADSTSFKRYAHKALKILDHKSHPGVTSNFYKYLGYSFARTQQFDSTYYAFDQAINYAKLAKDYDRFADYQISKADIYNRQGKTKHALETLLAAKPSTELSKDPTPRIGLTFVMGNVYLNNKEFEKASEKFKEAAQLFKDVNPLMYQLSIINWCKANNDLGNPKPSLENLPAVIKELGEEFNAQYASYNLALAHYIDGSYDKSLDIVSKNIRVAEVKKDLELISLNYRLKSRNYQSKNDGKNAVIAANMAMIIEDDKSNLDDQMVEAYKIQAKAYKINNETNKAINTYEKFIVLNDSLAKINQKKEILNLQEYYESESKKDKIQIQEEEIKTLNVQAKNDKLTKTLYSIGMFSFIAIAGLLFFGFKQRIKKNRIEREKQEEIYRQEIEFKKKELTSQTLHLVQKNTFIQELKENLVKIKQSPELFKVEFRRLVMLLKKESAEDKDWEVFKSYFTEVHNNFDIKIKEIYGDISEKEIRLASFLRMNLSTKEIASMLNVLPDSVLKSKYRLKKKLNLDKETDLNQFLNTL